MHILAHFVTADCLFLWLALGRTLQKQNPHVFFFGPCFPRDHKATKSLLDSGQWQYEYENICIPYGLLDILCCCPLFFLAEAQTAAAVDGSWSPGQRNPT